MQGCVFGCRCSEIGSVHGHAAQVNEFGNVTPHAVGLGNRLEDASRPGDIDAPHAIMIEDGGAQRIKYESEMNDRLRLRLDQQRGNLVAGGFVAKIKLIKRIRRGHERQLKIHSNDLVTAEQRYEAAA